LRDRQVEVDFKQECLAGDTVESLGARVDPLSNGASAAPCGNVDALHFIHTIRCTQLAVPSRVARACAECIEPKTMGISAAACVRRRGRKLKSPIPLSLARRGFAILLWVSCGC
jgi:hypothetical protein